MSALRFLVSGRVQGVFFRASTRERALKLGLRGHAVNLPDGRVEVGAAGNAEALEALAAWLEIGPRMAKVERVKRGEVDEGDVEDGFRTG